MKYSRIMMLALMIAAMLVHGIALGEAAPAVEIVLGDDGVTVDGMPAAEDASGAVYVANDIVYYESGRDFTYGDGSERDAHDAETAAGHTVVHIARPGTYVLSGSLSRGQIAVDLGEDAKDDPAAVVNLVFSGADISCEVAPAVIFYNVYECGSRDAEQASRDTDTSAAGANIIIADGSENNIRGSYVADIYDPGTVVLNGDETEVQDAEKLHSYDGAVYSRMSMNVRGGEKGDGVMNIDAENEGLCSELHLTVSGGQMNIHSGNDGVNANEDNLSVIRISGGALSVQVTGETGEGDGVDSNGWIVVDGGRLTASACASSADAGIDADLGIHIDGGTVIAGGHMLDRISESSQSYAVFSFDDEQQGGAALILKDENGAQAELSLPNAYSVLVYSDPGLQQGTYTLWSGETQLAGSSGGMVGRGMMFPGGRMQPPEGMDSQDMPEPPEGMDFGKRPERPEGMPEADMPGGGKPGRGFGKNVMETGEKVSEFTIKGGANQFSGIAPAE